MSRRFAAASCGASLLEIGLRDRHSTSVLCDGSLYRDASGNVIGVVTATHPISTYAEKPLRARPGSVPAAADLVVADPPQGGDHKLQFGPVERQHRLATFPRSRTAIRSSGAVTAVIGGVPVLSATWPCYALRFVLVPVQMEAADSVGTFVASFSLGQRARLTDTHSMNYAPKGGLGCNQV